MMRRRIAVVFAASAALSAAFCGGFWYAQHRHDAAWETTALRASFRAVQLEGESGHESPVFFYTVENTTGRDYEIRDMSGVELFVREKGVLDNWLKNALAIDLPVVIPAND